MRGWNFSAGPAALPEQVLQRAQEELLEWGGARASVMEVSHRGKAFEAMAARAESDLRGLLAIPENCKVLFLQGGATQHFAQIPMNFCAEGQRADYIVTGHWGEKAVKEAAAYSKPHVAASSAESNYTANETIHGVEFHDIPDVGGVPLVADMSSDILSRPIEVSRFGLIYAGAQ